jgi:hypothetical protein
MERGRLRTRCAAWGGVALGAGTLAFALCSPSNAGCATNLVVLTHSTVTARGCAAYDLAARLGVGLMVLGAVLLLGSFILAVRTRRHMVVDAPGAEARPITPRSTGPTAERHEPPRAGPAAARTGPIPPGGDRSEDDAPGPVAPDAGPRVMLPPGWYGNPDNPDNPVQWWDGTKLTDRPPDRGR